MTDTTGVTESYAVHSATTLLTPGQLVTAVAGLAEERQKLGLKTSRSSVGEWRRDLGFRVGPFKVPHAIALAYYGDLLGLRVPKPEAKEKTNQHIKALAEQEKQDA